MNRVVAGLILVVCCALGCGGGDSGADGGSPMTCTNTCGKAGATQCAGFQVQTCTADAKGCLSLSPAASCGSGKYCSITACVPCTNTCTQAGATQCAGSQVQLCLADVNGCLALSPPAPCGAGGYCSGSGCVYCSNSCAQAGVTECSGAQVRTCSADANGCLSFSAPSDCPGGKTCSASTNSCQVDPCHGVPTTGICADAQTVEYCGSPTGQGVPTVYSYACPVGESCSTDTGTAHCKVTGTCIPGATICLDATHLQTCNAGTPSISTCPTSCLNTALGSQCTAPIATTSVTLTIKYTVRGPNQTLTDWDTTTDDYTVSDLLVISYSDVDIVDAQTTDGNGNVTLLVPASPQPNDQIVLATAASDGRGGLAFLVADPGFSFPGIEQTGTIGTPRIWTWAFLTTGVTSGSTITITEGYGSGVIRVFDYLRYVYLNSSVLEGGRPGLSLVVWMGYGTSWDCGSCSLNAPVSLDPLQFNSQIWLDGNTDDERWWSDAVTAHELGHWVMASYGTSPGEGGPHTVGVPSLPGLDWSEGWATWHSSFARRDSIYYDKQGGAMFYFDIATDQYYPGGPSWQLPVAVDGLLQLMDENEVSSMLWTISTAATVGGPQLFTSLSGAHMNTSPWGRGYSRHVWDEDSFGAPIDIVDTGVAAPCVADFLDALDCAGVSRSVIDTATVPATQYPFPSGSPICP